MPNKEQKPQNSDALESKGIRLKYDPSETSDEELRRRTAKLKKTIEELEKSQTVTPDVLSKQFTR